MHEIDSWERRARQISARHPARAPAHDAFILALRASVERGWVGAAFAPSVLLYGLLQGLALPSRVVVGDVQVPSGAIFLHAWVEADDPGEPLDIGICQVAKIKDRAAPVFFGRSLSSGRKSPVRYGVQSGQTALFDLHDPAFAPTSPAQSPLLRAAHPGGVAGLAETLARRGLRGWEAARAQAALEALDVTARGTAALTPRR